MGFSIIFVFAGAIIIFLQTSTVWSSKLSAIPQDILFIVFAVAGAIKG